MPRRALLYGIILVLTITVVVIAMGGGVFDQSTPWPVQWQHLSFNSLCHQMADRSFWINGQPMAVCSRCIGIYGGFALGWILLPLAPFLEVKAIASIKKIVVFMLLLNIIDATGNFLALWQNTTLSRSLLGGVLGGITALIFLGDFFHRN